MTALTYAVDLFKATSLANHDSTLSVKLEQLDELLNKFLD